MENSSPNIKIIQAATISILIIVISMLLYSQGRPLTCICGGILLASSTWSSHTSQHLFDPYSFTHLLHGFLFFFILLLLPNIPKHWHLIIATVAESSWEILENSEYVINKYRADTIAMNYQGDAIINSVGDITCCITGFIVARQLGFYKSLIIFILLEITLIIWIRDSLILNIIMLLYPIPEIKQWQLG
ncbi:MAG: DUF2585 family protein [Acidobacteriota bacterium]|nr:DUF2585 family protein [Blastocatellia bacterium]MDW8411728.1 DUF2585 family protein [Acidobacteriota bacterium]